MKIISKTTFLLFGCMQVICARAASGDTTIIERSYYPDGSPSGTIYLQTDAGARQYDFVRSFAKSSTQSMAGEFPLGGWIEMQQYQGRYHLYHPCDFGNLFKMRISPRTATLYMMEEDVYRVQSISHSSKGIAEIKMQDVQGTQRMYKMYLIDRLKGIAVLESVSPASDNKYRLLVHAGKASGYPMIVNECKSKGDECNFEKIDFATLLKKAGYPVSPL